MAWVIAKKSDHSIVERSIKVPDFTQQELNVVIPANYGGQASDYSCYQLPNQEAVSRLRNGDSFDLVWSGDTITALDWSNEDSKRWVKIYGDEEEIDGDGIDECNITLEIWKADLSAIDTAVTISGKTFPILTPEGERLVKVNVTNGVATKAFKTQKAGLWKFPSRTTRVNNIRVAQQLMLTVRDTSVWD